MILPDQTGRIVSIRNYPERIISLVPSQTELLYDLGLDEEVIGITKFCVHPESWSRSKKRIGGTKNLNLQLISGLRPDLILGNKEENEAGQIIELAEKFPVWLSDINSIPDAMDMIISVGKITGKKEASEKLCMEINDAFNANESFVNGPEKKALYLIWKDPWMAAGRNTYINSMIEYGGFTNCMEPGSRYPELNQNEMWKLKPDLVFLSNEPYPFTESHIPLVKEMFPEALIVMSDGEMFSWYGSRMRLAPRY
ncbi:MAG: ABC transporter substrate-binding protein, partial [Bacteroidia bacterium]|nr:ABC transporter substrate-binding protein [Bacteroidia bacterium]